MDIAPSITTTTTTNNTASTKSPKADSETPIRIQPAKPISFSNGVLKRHAPAHHHHHTHSPLPITTTTNPVVVSYKECLKNHAASLGGHALDGCGEFMPSPTAVPTDPTSLKCAACGCHRNFHRREPEDNIPALPAAATTHVIEYQPHHRHHPPPPIVGNRSPNSASPPPISSSYYPSAPHMLLALSTGISGQENPNNHSMVVSPGPNSRKRFRTKFTQEQKDKMYQFAERVGWKMQKRDEDIVNEFCSDIGVDKGVLKVWMHNNKNTFAKRDVINGSGNGGGNGIPAGLGGDGVRVDLIGHHHHNMNGDNNNNNNGSNDDDEEEDNDNPHIINNTNGGSNVVGNPNRHHYQVGVGGGDHHHAGATNGGSSSSS